MLALLIAWLVCWFAVYAYRVLGVPAPTAPEAGTSKDARHLINLRDEIEAAFRNGSLVLAPLAPLADSCWRRSVDTECGAIPGEPMAYLDGDEESLRPPSKSSRTDLTSPNSKHDSPAERCWAVRTPE